MFPSIWHISGNEPMQSGDLVTRLTPEMLMDLLDKKIEQVSIDKIKDDTIRFIENSSELDIWSARYFRDVIKLLKFS